MRAHYWRPTPAGLSQCLHCQLFAHLVSPGAPCPGPAGPYAFPGGTGPSGAYGVTGATGMSIPPFGSTVNPFPGFTGPMGATGPTGTFGPPEPEPLVEEAEKAMELIRELEAKSTAKDTPKE